MRSAVCDLSSQPIRNIALSPLVSGGQWATVGAVGTYSQPATAGPFGEMAAMHTWTAASTDGGVRMRNAQPIPEGGGTISGGIWAYSSKAQTLNLRGWTYDASGAYLGGSLDINFVEGIAVPAGKWVWIQGVAVGRSPLARSVTPYLRRATGGGAVNWAAGDVLMATRFMMVDGRYTGPYSDGNTPGWKWDGAAGSSTSVGYPYTLASLVGQPTILFEGAFPSDIPIPSAAQKVRGYTLYAVTTPGPGTTRDTLVDGTSANQRIHITYGDGGQRWNMYQSQSSFTGVVNDANTRRVISARFDGGISRFLRDGVQASAASAGQAPQAVTALRIGANAAGNDPWRGTIEAVLLFAESHTDEQMAAVTRWIGARYGQVVA